MDGGAVRAAFRRRTFIIGRLEELAERAQEVIIATDIMYYKLA